MSGLNDSQLAIIRTLIDTAPDAAIRTLHAALAGETGPGPMSEIRDLVGAESAERRARNMAFEPLTPLCRASEPISGHETFPSKTLTLVWRGLKQTRPEEVEAAIASAALKRDADRDVAPFDELCRGAAAGLRLSERGPFQAAYQLLEAEGEGVAERFASYLDLAPLAREAVQNLPDWVARMTDDRSAAVRLAFRDAGEIAADSGPRLLEIFLAHLPEPWTILRVISALMFEPSDSYVASSELAHFGTRILTSIDSEIDKLRTFEPDGGADAGVAAAESARIAAMAISEFDQSLDINKEGPWGQCLARQRKELSQVIEARFNKIDDAVGAALPLKPVKFGARLVRGVPKLTSEPEEKFVRVADGNLAFLQHSRPAANVGGFSSLRAKTIEKLEGRLDSYTEDLIEHLRDPDSADQDRARVFLELAAGFVGRVRDEKAAQIVRRRAAA